MFQVPSSQLSTRILLLGIWNKLTKRRRIELELLLLVMLASGAAELMSLAAVLPFLAVLSSPEQLWEQPQIQALAQELSLMEPKDLLLPATMVFATAAILAAIVRLANLWLNGRLAAAIGSDLSGEAYRRTLYQPYAVHVQRNSSAVISTITAHVGRTVAALNATLQLLTSLVVAFSLLIGLFLINWKVAIASAGLFGSSYAIIGKINRLKLLKNGSRIAASNADVLKAVQEGLGAIRDVLLEGSQPYYERIYLQSDRPLRKFTAKNEFLTAFPRFALEALGMVGIALLGWLLVRRQGNSESIIPLLGALALGAQRLLPALQQAYSGWASLKGFNPDISSVLDMLDQPVPHESPRRAAMAFQQTIKLQGIRFRYGPKLPEVLRGIDLEIRRGERIGIIGTTGSGKSTMVDLLMGLLAPTSGFVLVDGIDLHDQQHPDRLSIWRMGIAHVPQSIFLADSSIAENIAFGVPKQQIDMDRVRAAAEQAQISTFIESREGGYSNFVGERGIQLSGGQRQRIGIARALYKQVNLLVLDEATSALDDQTESAVLESMRYLSKDITIVMITHRRSTLEYCDRVIEIDRGTVAKPKPT